ncbi:MAG: Rne/Rng family ribonuclease, partial [Candidatus Nanopelagicales bacterium]
MSQNNQSSAGDFNRVMIVNDTPGEECRIAILDQGRLDGLSTERVATATNVGNIYKGKVTNVEPAIQAAFVDFGEGQNGFLHISDLHPKYFPSGDKTEKVGKKVPRKSRPLMQEALKRGSEILVQVLKEGLGTKGPTLTSYLSIPGRLLVMMPGMDKVGVSRKVEDETQRKEMRRILDSLNLPEGFGFILRTAGFTATKTDLSRDAAYLTRLWKVMEKRMDSVGAPCELYTESDLLLRTLRDVLDTSISAIVVDSESALARASTFLSVIAPRSSPPVRYYGGKAPIFHAFDVERQIELIHAREVPLPSGGALVFDQAEALVAIDVNSGKSRSARDSETNAYRTNCEAVEEICRQLRLRDLGGLVVCDMIDMRSHKHRKDIQDRFTNAFKKDRARTTVLPVSDFGIVEITRQRMRPSLRKTHYAECPTCVGHGEIRLPDSVAADALR